MQTIMSGIGGLFNRVEGSGFAATENREIEEVFNVDMELPGTLSIHFGDTESLVINTDDNLLQYIQTKIKNNKLTLKLKDDVSIVVKTPLKIDLTLKKLDSIKNLSSADVFVDDYVCDEIKVRTLGSGDIEFSDLSSKNADIKIDSSGGVIFDSFICEMIKMVSNGSGNLEITEGKIKQYDVRLNSSGKILASNVEAFDQAGGPSEFHSLGSGKAELGTVFVDLLKLDLVSSGGWMVKKLNAKDLNIGIKGNGSVDIVEGKTSGLSTSLISSGGINAPGLVAGTADTELVKLNISGSGNCKIGELVGKMVVLKTISSGRYEIEKITTGFLEVSSSGSGDVVIQEGNVDGCKVSLRSKGCLLADGVMAGADMVEKSNISISGSGKARLGGISADNAELKTISSGGIRIGSLKSVELKINSAGSGNIRINEGEVDYQKVSLVSSGSYRADEMKSKTAEIGILGSGSARVYAEEQLIANINSSGSVRYKGEPLVQRKGSGGGRLQSALMD